MKKDIYKLSKWLLLLIGTLLFGFIIANNWFWHILLRSGLFIYFTFLLAVIFLLEYYIYDRIIENKRGIAVNFILLMGIWAVFYFGIAKIYNIFALDKVDSWLYYGASSIFGQFRNFLYLPYKLVGFDIYRYLFISGVINIIYIYLIFIYKYGEIKNNYLNYVVEELLRKFRSNILLILFGSLIFAVPKLYLYPRYLQDFFLIAFLIILSYLIISFIVTYLDLKREDKTLKNKDLFIILNLNNVFGDEVFSNTSDFKGFNNYRKSIFNKLILRSKNLDIGSYTLVRKNLIDTNKYKNTYYLIILDNFKLRVMSQKKIILLEKIIDDIYKKGIKFKIILKGRDSKVSRELKNKYQFCYKDKLNVPYIFKEVREDRENIKLKNRAQALNNKISDEKQYRYLKYSLNKIINSYNPIENFYTILKMTEYVLHYRALKNIVLKKDLEEASEKLKEGLKSPTFGTWIGYQKINDEKNKKYNDPEIIKAFNHIDDILKRPRKFEGKSVCFYQDICTYLLKMRNNILVHGVITYDVSVDLVEDLFTLSENIILAFLELNITILEHEVIEGLFKNDFQAIEEEKEMFYLYSYGEEKEKDDLVLEYLNYANGQVLVKAENNEIKIDERELR